LKISVKAKPDCHQAYVKQIDSTTYEVAVKEPPVEGRANRAIIAALSEHLNISKARMTIVLGWSSRQKIIEIK